MNNSLAFILNTLSIGNWYQNIFFYSLIIILILINIHFMKSKKNKKIRHEITLPQDLSDIEASLNETINTLKMEARALKAELMNIGEELEIAYVQSEKANNLLLEGLDCWNMEVELRDVGYWSVDLETQELFISDNGRLIYGISKEERLTIPDGLRLVDKEFREDMVNTITEAMRSGKRVVKNYRMTTLDRGESKWLMTSGNISYNDLGTPLLLSGSFVVMSS